MKKYSITVILMLLSLPVVFAQQIDNYHQDTTTLYQRSNGFYTDPVRSKWKKEVKQEGDFWIVSLFDKKVVQEEIPFADKELSERKGLYRQYHEGKLFLEGYYDKGYKVGEWKSYYGGGQLKEKTTYTWGKLNGSAISYWENGKEKAHRDYVNGKKSGMWRLYYPDGRVALHEIYQTTGLRLMGLYFDQKGDSVHRSKVLIPPAYPKGEQVFRRYLIKQLDPFKAELKNSCKVRFWVSREGWLYDIAIEGGPSPAFNRALIKAFKQSGKWMAGRELGEDVDMQDEMLFSFDFSSIQ